MRQVIANRNEKECGEDGGRVGGNIIKYEVHGEVVGGPSLPELAVAGMRRHGEKQEKKTIEKPATEGKQF